MEFRVLAGEIGNAIQALWIGVHQIVDHCDLQAMSAETRQVAYRQTPVTW